MKFTITANGATDAKRLPSGATTVAFSGAFDGATVTPQVSFDEGATWTDVTLGEVNAAGQIEISMAACMFRLNTSGAGGSTDIEAVVKSFTAP